jgi:hypothetical protein
MEFDDEGYVDRFDRVVITDAQAQKLFRLLTDGKTDCELRVRTFGARIQWSEPGSRHWLCVVVPRRRPMDFKVVTGGYRSTEYKMGLVAADKRQVVRDALNAMERVLGLGLKKYAPDWEAAQRFPENKRR